MIKNQLITLSTRQDVYRKIDLFMGKSPQKKYDVTLVEVGKKRRISANNQQHLWYGQIDTQGNTISGYAKRFCKYTFGVPILLNSDKHSDFYETLFDMCNFWKRSYETRVELMEGIEITSKFNTAESKEYMEQMIFYFNDKGFPIKFKDK
jgi:hypothetical protein